MRHDSFAYNDYSIVIAKAFSMELDVIINYIGVI